MNELFDKITTFKILKNGFEVMDSEMVKTAAEFILPKGHVYDPDFLYLKVRAVSAGEYWGPNKNADFFPEEELKKNYKTFLNAHTFKNHENKDIANAIGDVLDATWNDKMKYVELLIRVDRKVAPTIVRGFEKGFMTDVSMGCKIKHSVCSKCGNIAKTTKEYCEHVRNERHKIYPDGTRIYEINIGPTFHDISAVLNGADKTAKVTGLYIEGNKVAFMGFNEDENLEKVASFESALYSPENNGFAPFYKTEEYHMSKAASFEDVGDILEHVKVAKSVNDKEGFIQKIAEIKKIIEGKITAIANSQFSEKSFENIEDVMKLLKLFYTDYWDDEKCREIADHIKEIAEKRGISPETAFHYFCNTAELAGIELSSLEFNKILEELTDGEIMDCEDNINPIHDMITSSNLSDILGNHDSVVDEFGDNLNIPTAIKVIKVVNDSAPEISEFLGTNPMPLGRVIRTISGGITPEEVESVPYIDNDMMSIIRNDIPDRSFHRAHLVPRMIKIVKVDKQPNLDNLKHFLLPLLLKTSLAGAIPGAANGYGYSAYQNNRVKFAQSDDYAKGLEKFASIVNGYNDLKSNLAEFGEINKTAGSLTRGSVILGLPLTYGYSAMQRSRMKNGEDVSSFNRYVAENPASAYVVQAILSRQLDKKVLKPALKAYDGKIGPKIKDIANKVGDEIKDTIETFKKASDGDYINIMTKQADSIPCINEGLNFNIDIFTDKSINERLATEYSGNQSEAIKMATIMYAIDREDAYNEILSKNALSDDDVNKYLKISADSFRMEIEKQANEFWKNVAGSTAQDMMFNPVNSSAAALLPGNIVDGIILSKLLNKMDKDTNKKEQNKSETN